MALVAAVGVVFQGGLAQGTVRKPTPQEQLKAAGFEITPEGLKKALASPRAIVKVMAMRVIGERGDRSFSADLEKFLEHEAP